MIPTINNIIGRTKGRKGEKQAKKHAQTRQYKKRNGGVINLF
jgi:hypothetical protein